MNPDEVKAVIFSARLPMKNEGALQAAMQGRLAAAGADYAREVRLPGKAGRIDFTVQCHEGLLGIECKTKGGPLEWTRQLGRYGRTGLFTRLVLVTAIPHQLPLDHIAHEGKKIPIEIWPIPSL